MKIVQATDHVVEDPADLSLNDGLADFAAVLDLIEKTISVEVIDYPVSFAVLSTEIVGLHLCGLHIKYLY